MSSPIILIPVFKKIESLKRLLFTLEKADYKENFPLLLFSYHVGASQKVIDFILAYHWPHGEKIIRFIEEQLYLDEHIRRCGDLSAEYPSIIILEDDLVVSPFFYQYAIAVEKGLKHQDEISQISLVRGGFLPNLLPHHLLSDAHSFFAVQKVSSSGYLFTKRTWQDFRHWLKNADLEKPFALPAHIIGYGLDNWEFQYNAYLVDQKKYSAWPKMSLTSNQGTPGIHLKTEIDAGFYQSPLVSEMPLLRWEIQDKNCLRYDAFFNLDAIFFMEILSVHKLEPAEVEIDLYGDKPLELSNKPYWLSRKKCRKAIATFSDDLKPLEINVLWQFPGTEISLCRKEDIVIHAKETVRQKARLYFSEVSDIGIIPFIKYKWLKYVERKRYKG